MQSREGQFNSSVTRP
nr:unnamed protein product [Callosobruchus chinensis]CAH7727523.1 unnamed protein product [Callosobruchus chinensis]CAH7733366.1 unnamed protein product [Callosobruchus chinensis]CAH7735905.1 unnamed protein product [Callosobruchus chinensis]CAH7738281.1 unnamed protein product [Callosobruchus chinensis]